VRIAVAQLRPAVGVVESNLARHLELAERATFHAAELVIFPELSMTGYEPNQAAELARYSSDSCFEELQRHSDRTGCSIGVGVPLRTAGLPQIANLLFRPGSERKVFTKMHLHPDEEPFFSRGVDSPPLILSEPPIALAICFELSVPEHTRRALDAGPMAYIASVAKTANGTREASDRLAELARASSIPVLMSNCLGFLDGSECVGGTSAWDRTGTLIARLDDEHEGIIVMDLESDFIVQETLG
jgi:predicted amidohydrolase